MQKSNKNEGYIFRDRWHIFIVFHVWISEMIWSIVYTSPFDNFRQFKEILSRDSASDV